MIQQIFLFVKRYEKLKNVLSLVQVRVIISEYLYLLYQLCIVLWVTKKLRFWEMVPLRFRLNVEQFWELESLTSMYTVLDNIMHKTNEGVI